MSLALTRATLAEINSGWIGYGMYYYVTTPTEPKVDEVVSVSFYFSAEYDMHISSISVWLYGAGIGYSKTIVLDADVGLGTVITDTISVTPDYAGSIYCEIEVEYDFWYSLTHYYEYGDLDLHVGYARYTTYSELFVQYDDLLADYDALNSSYHQLQDNYDTLNSTYHSLLANYDELMDEHDQLTSDYDVLLTNYDNLQSAYDTLQFNHTQLEGNYNALKSDYDGLEANYTTLQNNYDSLQATYNSLDSTYNSLKANYDDLQSQHDTSISELDTTRNLSYILVVAALIFIATTVLFAIRKPKVKAT